MSKINRRSIPTLRIMDFNSPEDIKNTANNLKKKYKKVFEDLSKL